MYRILLLFSIVLFFCQCKSTKDYMTPYEYEGRSISFGNGGGFTGKSVDYTLMDNGQIFRGVNKEGNVDMIMKLSENEVTQIFNTYDLLGFEKMNVDSPGNMYFFVQMNNSTPSEDKKLVWGNYDAGETRELKLFYLNLMRLANKGTKSSPYKTEVK